METRYAPDPIRFQFMDTAELREDMLYTDAFIPGELNLIYSDIDRVIIGGAVPAGDTLKLEAHDELKAKYFAERREIGIINIGGDGAITVDGETYSMIKLDALYIGRGSKNIEFASTHANDPAYYYIISYPAHTSYPTAHAPLSKAAPIHLGSSKECNERTIYKYIHPDGIKSCQLVMGCTLMEEGSVWNTMPAHTHERRSEIYMYFDLDENAAVFKFIGEPHETRHLVVRNREIVLSPSWSIHSGAGTTNYSFIWAMGGENQDFGDMDAISVKDMM